MAERSQSLECRGSCGSCYSLLFTVRHFGLMHMADAENKPPEMQDEIAQLEVEVDGEDNIACDALTRHRAPDV